MVTLLLQVLFVGTPGLVTVNLAPDQPVPYVYVDEPLIVEFLSTEDVEFTAQITIESQGRPPVSLDLDTIRLRARAPRWEALRDLATERGRYRLRCVISAHGEIRETEGTFCRIDRPTTPSALPFYLHTDGLETDLVEALRGIPVTTLRLDANLPNPQDRATQAANAGFAVVMALDLSKPSLDEVTVEALAKAAGKRIMLWELSARDNPDRFTRFARALRRGAPHARLAARVSSPKELTSLFQHGAGPFFETVVTALASEDSMALDEFRWAAERAGYEGLAFHAAHGPRRAEAAAGTGVARHLIADMAQGFFRTAFDASLVYSDRGFEQAYCIMSAAARRLGRGVYIGPLRTNPALRAEVFRITGEGHTGDEWVLALWSPQGPRTATVSLGGALGLRLTDGLNNPRALPEPAGGEALISVTEIPFYLSGRGGPILARAACAAVREQAQALLGIEGVEDYVDQGLLKALESLADCDMAVPTRFEFFTLVRTIPEIEARWHKGLTPRATAVPLLARLSKLARRLCVLEQEAGEPFLEPLNETLAKCGEYQSLYLTGTGSAQGAQERGDWLLNEVRRLAEEAKALSGAGRPIEANAVAALAEWRARALRFAARAAPLSEADPHQNVNETETETETKTE